MKHLIQVLNTKDDSFSYTVEGESVPTYVVDNSASLYENGVRIGEYRLKNNSWHLYIKNALIASSRRDTLFNLPEFELETLTTLINVEE